MVVEGIAAASPQRQNRAMPNRAAHRFHRDPALPFVEVRDVRDARGISYARHSHDTFSIGLVTGGRSIYVHERGRDEISAGTVVMMNPGAMHACNPVDLAAWSYRMVHIDADWLLRLQQQGDGDDAGRLREIGPASTRDDGLRARLAHLCDRFADPCADTLARHEAIVELASALQGHSTLSGPDGATRGVKRVAELIIERCDEALTLADLCAASGLSESHLVRSFRKRYGMTPHAFLVDRRIQRARHELRRGRPIAEVAAALGFADQAHLQRTFRRVVATTPGQYRPAITPSA